MAVSGRDAALDLSYVDADPPPAWFLEWFERLPRARQWQFVAFCQDISKFPPGTRLPTFDEWTATLL